MGSVPLSGLVPLQPPVALQAVALVELHVRVAELPAAMDEGLAVRLTVGAGDGAGAGGPAPPLGVAVAPAPPPEQLTSAAEKPAIMPAASSCRKRQARRSKFISRQTDQIILDSCRSLRLAEPTWGDPVEISTDLKNGNSKQQTAAAFAAIWR